MASCILSKGQISNFSTNSTKGYYSKQQIHVFIQTQTLFGYETANLDELYSMWAHTLIADRKTYTFLISDS